MKKLLIISIAVFIFSNSLVFGEANNTKRPNIINLVYDDSGSMVEDNNGKYLDNWRYAKYATEVFAGMLNEYDELNIYPMSSKGNITKQISGKDEFKKRISDIYNLNSEAKGTPFSTVTKAGTTLQKKSLKQFERWLVIFTDGEFDNTSDEEVTSTLENYTKQGIHVVFLKIGNKVNDIKRTPNKLDVYYAATGTEIVDRLTEISYKVFNRESLKIENDSSNHSFKIDVPISEIIVFVQGENVKLDKLILPNGQELKAKEKNELKSTKTLPSNKKYLLDGLKKSVGSSGVIAKFSYKEDQDMPLGGYKLKVTDANSVNIYYKPDFKVDIELKYKGKIVKPNEQIKAGKYDYTLKLVRNDVDRQDKVNNSEEINMNSEVFKNITYSLTASDGIKTQTRTTRSGEITLPEGHSNIIATIGISKFLSFDTKREVNTLPILKPIKIETTKSKEQFSLKNLEKKENYVEATVVHADGSPLVDSEISRLSLDASLIKKKQKMNFVIKKLDGEAYYRVYFKYAKDVYNTAHGNVPIKLEAKLSKDFQTETAVKHVDLSIKDISLLDRVTHWLETNWWWVLLALILLGYVPGIKKYLPSKLRPRIKKVEGGARNSNQFRDKNIRRSNLFIPYMPVSGSVQMRYGDSSDPFVADLKIRAVNSAMVRVLNLSNFADPNLKFKINGKELKEEWLHKPKDVSIYDKFSYFKEKTTYTVTLRN
jgi:hypothetical protein